MLMPSWPFTTCEAITLHPQGCLIKGENPCKCPASVALFGAPQQAFWMIRYQLHFQYAAWPGDPVITQKPLAIWHSVTPRLAGGPALAGQSFPSFRLTLPEPWGLLLRDLVAWGAILPLSNTWSSHGNKPSGELPAWYLAMEIKTQSAPAARAAAGLQGRHHA